MSDSNKSALRRLSGLRDQITSRFSSQDTLRMDQLPWNPDSPRFPLRKNLPKIEGAPEGAAWVWGKDDYKGRVNLLTPSRVKAALKEVKTGEIVPVNLPLNIPDPPAFGRQSFKHTIKELIPNFAYDDLYDMNTQSGSQWDGLRHVGHPHGGGVFYNNTNPSKFVNPSDPSTEDKNPCSMHHWAEHGIAGRALLLDVWTFAQQQQKKEKPWDPNASHSIPLSLLYECGKAQGVDIRPETRGGDVRPGDILLVRSGWGEVYKTLSPEERRAAAIPAPDPTNEGENLGNTFAGVEQSEEMVDWLHDCYFAAVGGDAPAFECWPTQTGWLLHSYLLACWGMPLGEMLDLEKLGEKCRERGSWWVFFSSMPANCVGGVGSHVNGQCIL